MPLHEDTAPPAILVVEDDPDLRDLELDLLRGAGYEVVVARNGAEALDSVGRGMPRIILLDMLMPVMDGWEFARQLRARYGHAAAVVVVTAAEQAAERGAEVEADAVIAKPFGIDALLECVAGLMNGSRDPSSLPPHSAP